MRRREFIIGVGLTSAALARPIPIRAQQSALPVVAVVSGRSAAADAPQATAFLKGLNDSGYIDGQNVTVEYHYVEGPIRSTASAYGSNCPPAGSCDRHDRE